MPLPSHPRERSARIKMSLLGSWSLLCPANEPSRGSAGTNHRKKARQFTCSTRVPINSSIRRVDPLCHQSMEGSIEPGSAPCFLRLRPQARALRSTGVGRRGDHGQGLLRPWVRLYDCAWPTIGKRAASTGGSTHSSEMDQAESSEKTLRIAMGQPQWIRIASFSRPMMPGCRIRPPSVIRRAPL